MLFGSRGAVLSSLLLLSLMAPHALAESEQEKLKVLIVDGRNNHDWRTTTPILQHLLRTSGRFRVDVATSPPEGEDLGKFRPPFSDYDVVVSNYNSQTWDRELKKSFAKYLSEGGGFVCIHAANNAFTKWPEYNQAIGLGGWGGRKRNAGPYVYFKNDKLVRDDSPGRCGHHGPQHEYQVKLRDPNHPITMGMPTTWLHTRDELYDSLRGPAENMTILATAYSDPKHRGTDRDEPMFMVLQYGKGRVFHTVMGHADYSMRCVGFTTVVQRGTEWAATGKVTIPIPENFPSADVTTSWE